jgi:hypothetical protein
METLKSFGGSWIMNPPMLMGRIHIFVLVGKGWPQSWLFPPLHLFIPSRFHCCQLALRCRLNSCCRSSARIFLPAKSASLHSLKSQSTIASSDPKSLYIARIWVTEVKGRRRPWVRSVGVIAFCWGTKSAIECNRMLPAEKRQCPKPWALWYFSRLWLL